MAPEQTLVCERGIYKYQFALTTTDSNILASIWDVLTFIYLILDGWIYLVGIF